MSPDKAAALSSRSSQPSPHSSPVGKNPLKRSSDSDSSTPLWKDTAGRVGRLKLSSEEIPLPPPGTHAPSPAISAPAATANPSHQALIANLARIAEETPVPGEMSQAKILFDLLDESYWDSGPRGCLASFLNKSVAFKHLDKNRYPDVFPYDGNLWKIPGLPDDFYLNASPITFPGVNITYVATQGPLPTTRKDFLSAVTLSGCPLVVTLADPVEGGKPKTDPWWEHCSKPQELIGGFTIQLAEENIPLEGIKGAPQYIVERKFDIRDKEGKLVRVLTQLHYVGWPDMGAPDPERLDELCRRVNGFPLEGATLVAHCSAGCGRVGTFFGIHAGRKIYASTRTVNIPEIVIHMRKQRLGMVQTPPQLRAIHKGLLTTVRQS